MGRAPGSHSQLLERAFAERVPVDGFPICVSGANGSRLYSDERDAAFALAAECYPGISLDPAGDVVECGADCGTGTRIATVFCPHPEPVGSWIECAYEDSYETRSFLLALGEIVRWFLDEPMSYKHAHEVVDGAGLFMDGAWVVDEEDVRELVRMLSQCIADSSARDPHVCAMGMKVNEPTVQTDGSGRIVRASLTVDGSYFNGREAFTMNGDGFFVIAGWADSRNTSPFAAAVVRWVELLEGSDDGEEKVGERDDV